MRKVFSNENKLRSFHKTYRGQDPLGQLSVLQGGQWLWPLCRLLLLYPQPHLFGLQRDCRPQRLPAWLRREDDRTTIHQGAKLIFRPAGYLPDGPQMGDDSFSPIHPPSLSYSPVMVIFFNITFQCGFTISGYSNGRNIGFALPGWFLSWYTWPFWPSPVKPVLDGCQSLLGFQKINWQ